ncbi:MAG: pyrroline-5-carboxylate reductase [Proteobacteria bacterium]|jgi:pyrroline-5-carboxylate reductase|nr:pyrroline-5-carboxylate reductase [Pseudomonadota bacterium]
MTGKLSRPLLLVGCGKMGSAMLEGWCESGIAAAGVTIIEPMGAPAFEGRNGISVCSDAVELPSNFDPEVVVFAVKPQQMDTVAPAYARFVSGDTVYLSIAAGRTIGYFEEKLAGNAAIVRAMPNTPAAIGQGITVLCPNAKATAAQAGLCRDLLAAVGEAIVVDDETLIDAVTALSGGGPAYVFLMIECLSEAGVQAGLPADLSARLALATVAGSGQLALAGDEPPSKLRENVTSPGGTTLEALKILMANDGLQPLMTRAIAAATRRSRELAGN